MHLHELHQRFRAGQRIYDIEMPVTYYARVSTDSEEQENSLQNQKSFFEDMIQKNEKWEFVEGYVDEGLTGTSVKKRTAFLRMIEAAKAGKFQLVLTKEVSRFARDTVDSLQYTRLLLDHGVGVFFINDNINTLDSDGELRLTIMSSIAQDESRKISERIRFGFKKAISDGKIIGNVPLGYVKVENGLQIVEKEAEMIRKIFELYNSGLGFRLIGDRLAELGYFASSGNMFSTSVISNIIRNPKYKGCLAGGRYRKVSYRDQKQVRTPESEWVLTRDHEAIPAIVDTETWDRANELYKRKREYALTNTPVGKAGQYLYSGKLICMEHGLSFHRIFSKQKEKWQCQAYRHRGVYGCAMPHFYTSELNTVMRVVFEGVVKDREKIVRSLTKQIEEFYSIGNFADEIRNVKHTREDVERSRQLLIDLLLDGTITKEDYKTRNQEHLNRLEKIDAQHDELLQAEANVKTVKLNLGEIENVLRKYTSFDDEMVLEEFIRDFLDRIEVSKSEYAGVFKLNIVLKNGIYESPTYFRKNGRGASGTIVEPSQSNKPVFFSGKRITLSFVT